MSNLTENDYDSALAVLDELISENSGRSVRIVKDVRLMVKAMENNQ